MRNQRGVTLIALVIMIIVLLILAGVSIATLAGEDGILTQASSAAEETKVSDAQQSITLASSTAMSGFYQAKHVEKSTTLTSVGEYVIEQLATVSYPAGHAGVTAEPFVKVFAATTPEDASVGYISITVEGKEYFTHVEDSGELTGWLEVTTEGTVVELPDSTKYTQKNNV